MIVIKKKELTRKTDERGWLAELMRTEDVSNGTFGQLLITTAKPGLEKGGHYHLRKREWYIVLQGKGQIRIWDKKSSETATLDVDGEHLILVEIPIGFFHSIKNTGVDELHVLVYLSEAYNPEDSDTYYE